MTKQDEILTTLLKCGTSDLNLLEDIDYDLDDILKGLIENNRLSLHNIFIEVFIKGAIELQERFNLQEEEIRQKINDALIEEKKIWLDSEKMEEELEENEEYEELINDLRLIENEELNPANDLDYYLNYLDTHVYMKNIGFYRRWMENEVDEIEDNMGFIFE